MDISEIMDIARVPKITILSLMLFLFLLFIPMDMLNGLMLRAGLPSISLIFKSVVLILCALILIKRNKVAPVIFFTLLLFLYFLFHFIVDGSKSFDSLLAGLIFLVKFLSIFLFYFLFLEIRNLYGVHPLYVISLVSFWALSINTVFGLLGYGYGMYGGSPVGQNTIGTRGFIYAGNEIGVALIASASVVMMKLINEGRFAKYSAISIVLLGNSAALASKVPIVGSILIVGFLPTIKVLLSTKGARIKKRVFFYFAALFLLLPFISGGVIYYALYESNLIKRLSFFYDKMDWLSLILSSRNIWAEEALAIYVGEYGLLKKAFGTGLSWSEGVSHSNIVEIDPIDFLMSYGFLGLFIMMSLWFLLIVDAFKKFSGYGAYVLFLVLLLMGISVTAGHLIGSGTAGYLLAIVFAMNCRDRNFPRNI